MKKSLWCAAIVALLCAGAVSIFAQSWRLPSTNNKVEQLRITAQEDSNQWPDWKKHANWCANIDDGSSHKVYLSFCHHGKHDQYDSVLECQRDAGKNNGDGGRAVRAIQDAGRSAVNEFMKD